MSVLRDKVFCFIFIIFIPCVNGFISGERECKMLCYFRMDKEQDPFYCNSSCQNQLCDVGCDLYPGALETYTCQDVCGDYALQNFTKSELSNGIAVKKVQWCVKGCRFGLDTFFRDVVPDAYYVETDFVLVAGLDLPAPIVVRENITHSSVELEWWGDARVDNFTFLLQLRVLDTNTEWQVHNNTEIVSPGRLNVTELLSYVTYEFKLIYKITSIHYVESSKTAPVITLSAGAPSRPPRITSLVAPSPTVVSVSWTPPLFTNGALVSYRLSIYPASDTDHVISSDVLPHNSSWIFGHLLAGEEYVVTIAAVNKKGAGPADVMRVTTPTPGNLSEKEMPYLILGAENTVVKQRLLELTREADTILEKRKTVRITDWATVLFESNSTSDLVQGVGVHVEDELILVSDTSGRVTLISVSGDTENDDVYPSLSDPTAIDVDWLNNHAYIVDGYRIYRCPIRVSGRGCKTVFDNALTRASLLREVKVDPINGYLYYTLMESEKGLYRVDMAELDGDSVPSPRLLIEADLRTFFIEYDNLKLYFPNNTQNTIMSMYLDGTGVQDVRQGTVARPHFTNIESMISFEDKFFWTNGTKVFSEEYDSGNRTYYHNSLLLFEKHFCAFNMYYKHAQPIPVPFNPPSQLQVLFTSFKAMIEWQPPATIIYQGRGAFNKWDYEVMIQKEGSSVNTLHETSRHMQLTVSHLEPDTKYRVAVRAKSKTGMGPWSPEFIGRTLSRGMDSARLVVAVRKQNSLWNIVETDLDGSSPTTISPLHFGITDLDWYNNIYWWTTENAGMFMYREGDAKPLPTENNAQAVCLAFDWLGNKLYWSDKQSRVIERMDLSETNTELVYQAYARDIVLDSLNGRLYWVTVTTVETAYLNGNNHATYFSLPDFNGVNVISLAIDHDHEKLVWYVKGFNDESLYMADLYHTGSQSVIIDSVQLVATFNDIHKFSPIQYFSDRLIWLDNNLSVTIGNRTCNHTSTISSVEGTVSMFTVKHESLHRYPDNLDQDTVKVIPEAIPQTSIQSQGTWSHFNVTWQPCSEVNHGEVSYELSIQTEGFVYPFVVTKENWFELDGLAPYVLVNVSVRGFTYWGLGPITKTTIMSPMAAPGQPQDPRVYVTQRKNGAESKLTLAADFRWSEPESINGILSEQHVFSWRSSAPDEVSSTTLLPSARHFILDGLEDNTTYFFQVESCTPVACGEKSAVANVTADAVKPVPKLLIATKDAIVLAEADTVLNNTRTFATIATVANKAVRAMSYLSQDDMYCWLTVDNSLERFKDGASTKLLELEGDGQTLTLDWVSRTVYVCENGATNSSIISYTLDQLRHSDLIVRQNTMGDVIVDPYTSTLLWSEKSQDDSHWILMRAKTDGSSIVTHFSEGNQHRSRRALPTRCNCPSDALLAAGTMTMDLSHDGNTEVIFVDEASMSLMASDMSGCTCRTLMTTTADDRKGLPADQLTVDHVFVYWYNKASGHLYSLDKATHKVDKVAETGISDILAFGSHLHPLPASECLDLKPYMDRVEIASYTNISITASLNEVTWPDFCENISHPAIKYTVYYRKRDIMNPMEDCGPSGLQCMNKTLYTREITLEGLEPYTDYILQGAVSNYYSEYSVTSLGQAVSIRTKPGVPAPVVNFTATTFTPDKIEVMWQPPYPANGDLSKIIYNVKWTTQTPDGTLHVGERKNITFDMMVYSNFEIILEPLAPDQTYSIQVICYQLDGGYTSESAPVLAHTYERPGDLELVDATNTSIKLSWQSPSDDSAVLINFHYTELSDVGFGTQMGAGMQVDTNNNTVYNETFFNLNPNTDYAFGLNIMYKPDYKIYPWPKDETQFIFKTLPGIPGEPEPPMVKDIKTGEFEVSWLAPDDNGEPIFHYNLQYKLLDRDNWTLLYNTSEQRWVVSDTILRRGYTYMFRVSAENKNGWGPYSMNSSLFSYPIIEMEPEDGYLIIIVVICALVFIIIALSAVAFCMFCRRKKEEKKKHSQFLAVSRGPDLELATLRELPMTAVQQSNDLYAMNLIPTDDDIAALPHFRRDQLVLCKFLGSGAFGEVFEGVAKNILNESSGDTRCAVKTLRKSASDQEKEEFLKEALLMSNFRHEHILSLLGVCLDNDPQFIILELMEGGDLLSFMRACRLSSIQNRAELSLTDLVKICVHVSRGCKYLEDMHFVHRDLAARNCLVSSCNPSNMVIKIGDFGLARDIYKNDYYRKEGEGLLPVRWMSPESLVDGVFTTQSDIWAFGVMMWEVVTFGQQPYPARTNIEVLHFVRSGGRLDRPDNCPDDFYQLMCKCWNFAPEDRPSFAYLLQQLEKFQETCASISEYLVPIRSNNGPIAAGGIGGILGSRPNHWRSSHEVHPSDPKMPEESGWLQVSETEKQETDVDLIRWT